MDDNDNRFAEHVARMSQRGYRPGEKEQARPSRFPKVFPNLAAEEWAASCLHHVVEDVLLCEDEKGLRQLEDGAGICITSNFGSYSVSARYLILLDSDYHDVGYREWMIEGTEEPYWRIILRTAFASPTGKPWIMAIAGDQGTPSRLALNLMTADERDRLGYDQNWY